MSADEPDDVPDVPEPQTERSRGSGGKRVITAIGLGDGGGGDGDFYDPRKYDESSSSDRPVLHGRLKDFAIEMLAQSEFRDYVDVYRLLAPRLSNIDFVSTELADVLTKLVVSAYVLAQHAPGEHVLKELNKSFSCFSEKQLIRIIDLAMRGRPSIR